MYDREIALYRAALIGGPEEMTRYALHVHRSRNVERDSEPRITEATIRRVGPGWEKWTRDILIQRARTRYEQWSGYCWERWIAPPLVNNEVQTIKPALCINCGTDLENGSCSVPSENRTPAIDPWSPHFNTPHTNALNLAERDDIVGVHTFRCERGTQHKVNKLRKIRGY